MRMFGVVVHDALLRRLSLFEALFASARCCCFKLGDAWHDDVAQQEPSTAVQCRDVLWMDFEARHTPFWFLCIYFHLTFPSLPFSQYFNLEVPSALRHIRVTRCSETIFSISLSHKRLRKNLGIDLDHP